MRLKDAQTGPPVSDSGPAGSTRRFWYGLLAWFALTTTTLLGMGLLIHQSLEAVVEDSARVSRTHQVLEALEGTISALKDAETAERGFVITGKESYLQPYYSARAHAMDALGRIATLTRDNPTQQSRMVALRQAVSVKLNHVDGIVEIRRTAGAASAQAAVDSGEGKRKMDVARELERLMAQDERALLQARKQNTLDSTRRAELAVTTGIVVSLAILLLIFYLVVREGRRRTRVEAAARQANHQLEETVGSLTALRSELTELATLGDLLQSCNSFAEAYVIIGRSMPKLFPDTSGAVGMMKASQNFIETVLTWGNKAISHELFAPEDCWSLRRGRMHLASNAEHDLVCLHSQVEGERSTLCYPMAAHGKTTGVLMLSSEVGPGLDPLKQDLARRVSELISLSLANLRLQESLRIQSLSDPLTGLFSRRYMESSLERELARHASRSERLPVDVRRRPLQALQ